ncbi:MAG: efflux RND transporter periplasmic adaptor subunit [Magnetococcales bacterium]|nr:efflux RND transporter periplasmic adaptor subunit [Magnetococcales bacterium]
MTHKTGWALVTATVIFSGSVGMDAAENGLRKPSLEQREIRAQLAPHRYTTLSAEVAARISRIAVQEGGSFRAGQVLVTLDCSMQQAQLDKSVAALAATRKVLSANKRLAELHSVGKVELGVSEAEEQKAHAEVKLMTVAIGKCHIAAPFAGRVAEQKVREQQYVQPGQPVLDIIDDSVLELEFLVPSRWLVWLKPDLVFQVQIDETARNYPARILRIGAKVDPVSQSVKLVAAINGRFPELIAGMSGHVQMVQPADPVAKPAKQK